MYIALRQLLLPRDGTGRKCRSVLEMSLSHRHLPHPPARLASNHEGGERKAEEVEVEDSELSDEVFGDGDDAEIEAEKSPPKKTKTNVGTSVRRSTRTKST